jgi:hypothetical protein
MIEFTFGGSMAKPRVITERALPDCRPTEKWSRYFSADAGEVVSGPTMNAFLKVRRGIATGAGSFFVMPRETAIERGFSPANYKPILPSPRHVKGLIIDADETGWPVVDRQLAVIDTNAPLRVLRETDPALAAYLANAPEKVRDGYLVRQRELWYRQEQRPPAPFLCTYMGRGVDEQHPFRFILNLSDAIATNMFLMLYPTPLLMRYVTGNPEALFKIHEALLSITAEDLRAGGRVYGGGLHKMEPKEFAALSAAPIVALAPDLLDPQGEEQLSLLADSA